MTGVVDGFTISNGGAATSKFPLHGGQYGLIAVATWGGGNLAFNMLAPDGVTYVPVLPAITANAYATIYLPRGSYEFIVTTATAVYANLLSIQT